MQDLRRLTKDALIQIYLEMTKVTLPALAKTKHPHWPVSEDHCFQRIVLDNVCQTTWYTVLPTPAYKHLSKEQALAAVNLCLQIKDDQVELSHLNHRSLQWRDKQRTFHF